MIDANEMTGLSSQHGLLVGLDSFAYLKGDSSSVEYIAPGNGKGITYHHCECVHTTGGNHPLFSLSVYL